MSSSPHLLIVGGGHASIALLKRMAVWPLEEMSATLLSEHPMMYYSGMVPEHVGGVYSAEEARIDLPAWCGRAGARWQQGRAVSLDPGRQLVETETGQEFSFDLAVFDIGSVTPRPIRNGEEATPKVAETRTKPLHRLEALEQRIGRVLTGEPLPVPYRLAIAGGGAAGVEIALNLSARTAGCHHGEDLQLILIEPSSRLLTQFPAGMGRYAKRLLRERGVEVRLDSSAQAVIPEGMLLEGGQTVPCKEVLWATGTTGQPLFQEAGLRCDQRGFLKVRRTLQSLGHPQIFAGGDCAAVQGYEGLARTGAHAIKQGKQLCRNVEAALRALLRGRSVCAASLKRFRPYPVAPLILSTGGPEGLWSAGPVWFRGSLALRLKHFIDLGWISRYQPNRPAPTFWQKVHRRTAHMAAPRAHATSSRAKAHSTS